MLTQHRHRIGGYRAGQRPQNTKYHNIGRFGQEQLPSRVDLRKYMTEVEEQVGNSCVANAFVGAYEYLAKRDLGDSEDVSRLFVYYNARAQMGSEITDEGTQMYCAIDTLIEHGACSENIWPNDEGLLCEKPSEEAYEHAANFKIVESEFIETDLTLWRHTLAEGYPIVFALNTFESFDDATTNRGRVLLPKRSDNVRETHGWHAMLCVGYSDKDRMFIVRNSWGSAWGDRGYCYIPYDYIIHQDYNGHDSWIIKSISDLDFSAEVWEDEESFFADENSLLLYNFYIRTTDPETFIEALDQLCQSYVESEEEYYFDYEEEEEDEAFVITILNFDLTIEQPDGFLEDLDVLCQTYAIDEDYDFNSDNDDIEEESEENQGYEYEYEYEEEESEEEESEEDEDEEEEDEEEEEGEEEEDEDEEEGEEEEEEGYEDEDEEDYEEEEYEEDSEDEEYQE